MTAGPGRAALGSLPPLLRQETALAAVVGRADATLAVPGSAQAFVLAGLARLSERRPLLVVTPTVADAERLADDLACYLPGSTPDDETARRRRPPAPRWGRSTTRWPCSRPGRPSPSSGSAPTWRTMGRRLAVLWRLLGDRPPARPAAGWWWPRCGPCCSGSAPWSQAAPARSWCARATASTRGARWPAGRRRLPAGVPGRAPGRAGGAGRDRRRLPVDRRRRPCASTCGATRSTGSPTSTSATSARSATSTSVDLFGCRELLPSAEVVRARAAELVGTRALGAGPVGAAGRGPDLRRHGVVAAVARSPTSRLLTDLLAGRRPGRAGRAPPRARPGRSSSTTRRRPWPRRWPPPGAPRLTWTATPMGRRTPPSGSPGSTCPSTGCWPAAAPPVLSLAPVAEGPRRPGGDRARASSRWPATPPGWPARWPTLVADGYSVTLCSARRRGRRRAWPPCWPRRGSPSRWPSAADAAQPASGWWWPPLDRGFVLPGGQGGGAGRGRRHRAPDARTAGPGPGPGPPTGSSTTWRRAATWCTASTGWPATPGWPPGPSAAPPATTCCSSTGASDKLYLPVDQIEAVTPYSGGRVADADRMGGAEWQRTRARARAAAGRDRRGAGRALPAPAGRRRATPSPPTPRGSASWRRPSPSPRPPTSCGPSTRSRPTWSSRGPMDRLVCGDVGLRQDRGGGAGRLQGGPGRQAGGGAGAHHAAGQPALPDLLRPLRRLPGAGRDAQPLPLRAQARKVVDGLADGSVDVVVGTHRLLAGTSPSRTSACWWSTRSSASGSPTRRRSSGWPTGVDVLTLTASPIPRTLEMALTGIRDLSLVNTPPADRQPILTYVGEYDEAAVSEAIRRELLREGQVFYVHNRVADIEAVARRLRRARARGPRRRGPRPDGRGHPRAGRPRLLGAALRRAGVHDHHRVGHRHADGQHPGGRPGRPARPGPAAPAPGPGRPGRPAGLRLPLPPGRPGPLRGGLRAAAHHRRAHRARARASRSPCATWRSGGRATCSARDQSGHIAAVGYDLYVQMVAEAVAEARGRAAARARRGQARRARRRPPAGRLRGRRGRPARGLPAAGRRRHRRPRSTTWPTSGWTASGRCPPAAEGLLALARLRVECLRTGVTEVAVVPARVGGARQPVGPDLAR